MTTRPGYIWSGTEWVAIGQEAVLAPISYQTSAPSSPATGDVWIDSNDDVPSVNSTLYYRWKKTAAGGETSFTGTDDNSLTLAYTAGYESVFINGVLQVRGSDYTATTGTSITGLTALTAGDIVMVESVMAYSVGDTYTQSQMTSLLGGKSDVSTTGLVLVSSTTIGNSVTSITVNNAFSSSFTNYQITYTDGVSSATYTDLSLQLSGITANYYSNLIYTGWGSGGPTVVRSGSIANWKWVGASTPNGGQLNVTVTNPNIAQYKSFSARYSEMNSTLNVGYTDGFCASTSTATGFVLAPLSGTLTGGTIKVYGYK